MIFNALQSYKDLLRGFLYLDDKFAAQYCTVLYNRGGSLHQWGEEYTENAFFPDVPGCAAFCTVSILTRRSLLQDLLDEYYTCLLC